MVLQPIFWYKMLTENQQMLTKIQQMLVVVENEIFWLSDSIQIFSIVNYLLVSRRLYLQLFLVRKIYVKMVKKMKNVKTSKKIFRQFKRYDDMSMSGWKHVPQKCFEHLIILTNPLLVKTPSTFATSWKNDVFLPIFYLQQKFSHVWSTSVDQIFAMKRKP